MEAEGATQLDLLSLGMGLFGGLALFLFGMEQLTQALRMVAGDRMRKVLAALTTNRFTGVLTGAFVTAVIQSSSVTTVLVVGFISAGLLTLSQSIGVIMGANIGTTITAQIIAFKVTKFALAIVALGFAGWFLGRGDRVRQIGQAVMGLGLIFFGMAVMGDAMAPLRSYPPFLDAMLRLEQPLLGILAGAVFTALVQSSSVTTGIVIVMAGQGLIGLPAGIALIFGSNVGTCVTALLAAIGKPREALRAAVVHVAFNVAGVLIWLGFIDHLVTVVTAISPYKGSLSGMTRLAAETPRQIANAHTIFNVVNTLVFVGFSERLARFIEWLVPEMPPTEGDVVRAKFLDDELLSTPPLALDRAHLEIQRLGRHTREMFVAILPAILTGSRADLHAVARMDDFVDGLHARIITYLGKISRKTLTAEQTDRFLMLMEAANDLESIGDIIETNLVALGRGRIDQGISVSPATTLVIRNFHTAVGRALDRALDAFSREDRELAAGVVAMKPEVNRLAAQASRHQMERLVAEEPKRLPAYGVEMDVLENLKRVFYFAKRMARGMKHPTNH